MAFFDDGHSPYVRPVPGHPPLSPPVGGAELSQLLDRFEDGMWAPPPGRVLRDKPKTCGFSSFTGFRACFRGGSKSPAGQFTKRLANIGAPVLGTASLLFGGASLLGCIPCAGIASGLDIGSAVADVTAAYIECTDGGGFDHACLSNIAGRSFPSLLEEP